MIVTDGEPVSEVVITLIFSGTLLAAFSSISLPAFVTASKIASERQALIASWLIFAT